MVLTACQITAFFEDAAQMGFSNSTIFYSLNDEGIMSVYDLTKREDDDWYQWTSNCKKPDSIPDPINAFQLIYQVLFPLSVKSLKCLKIASSMVC